MLTELDRILAGLPRAVQILLAIGGIALIAAIEFHTGHEISFSVYFLAPVSFAAWYAGRKAGIAIALLSGISWYAVTLGIGHKFPSLAMGLWAALGRLGLFLITALLLETLHKKLALEQQLSRTDGLTGLLNTRAFMDRLEHDIALSRRNCSALTLAYLDVDDFKLINDRYGHLEGDRVLSEFGRILGSNMRSSDTAARIGGDEFALLLPDTDLSGAKEVVSKIRQEIMTTLGSTYPSLGCSIGVVTFGEPPPSVEEAIRVADRAMYEVKGRGKNAADFLTFP